MKDTRTPNGTGTYKKRKDGRYEWQKRINGERIYLYAKTPKELKAKVEALGIKTKRMTKLTFQEYANERLQSMRPPILSKDTYNQYSYFYEKFYYPAFGKKAIEKITATDLQNMIIKAYEDGHRGKTLKHARSYALSVLNHAKKDKLINDVPDYNDIKIPTTPPTERKPHTPNEAAQIIKAMSKSRWRFSVEYSLESGSRRSEILSLKWEDVEIENNRIRNYNHKNNKVAYIPLTASILNILNKQRELLLDEGIVNSQYVFCNNKGEHMDPKSYYTTIKRITKRAGINTSPHRFRHTWVYANKGALSIPELQSVLGHSSATQTTDIYGNMLNDKNDELLQKMETAMETFKNKMNASEKKENKIISFKQKNA